MGCTLPPAFRRERVCKSVDKDSLTSFTRAYTSSGRQPRLTESGGGTGRKPCRICRTADCTEPFRPKHLRWFLFLKGWLNSALPLGWRYRATQTRQGGGRLLAKQRQPRTPGAQPEEAPRHPALRDSSQFLLLEREVEMRYRPRMREALQDKVTAVADSLRGQTPVCSRCGQTMLRHSPTMTRACSPELTRRPGRAGDDNALPTYGLRTKVRRMERATLTEHKWVLC